MALLLNYSGVADSYLTTSLPFNSLTMNTDFTFLVAFERHSTNSFKNNPAVFGLGDRDNGSVATIGTRFQWNNLSSSGVVSGAGIAINNPLSSIPGYDARTKKILAVSGHSIPNNYLTHERGLHIIDVSQPSIPYHSQYTGVHLNDVPTRTKNGRISLGQMLYSPMDNNTSWEGYIYFAGMLNMQVDGEELSRVLQTGKLFDYYKGNWAEFWDFNAPDWSEALTGKVNGTTLSVVGDNVVLESGAHSGIDLYDTIDPTIPLATNITKWDNPHWFYILEEVIGGTSINKVVPSVIDITTKKSQVKAVRIWDEKKFYLYPHSNSTQVTGDQVLLIDISPVIEGVLSIKMEENSSPNATIKVLGRLEEDNPGQIPVESLFMLGSYVNKSKGEENFNLKIPNCVIWLLIQIENSNDSITNIGISLAAGNISED